MGVALTVRGRRDVVLVSRHDARPYQEEVTVGAIRLSRIYDHEPRPAGKVFLVERLWPRGIRRDEVDLDGWLKDVAPSTGLRRWFSHDPDKWEEFRRRYVAELDAHPHAWQSLVGAANAENVTLLYSSRDREHNNAVVLRDYLQERLTTKRKG
jgi:uncharacterized protein YeaO (DUF488 family)